MNIITSQGQNECLVLKRYFVWVRPPGTWNLWPWKIWTRTAMWHRFSCRHFQCHAVRSSITLMICYMVQCHLVIWYRQSNRILGLYCEFSYHIIIVGVTWYQPVWCHMSVSHDTSQYQLVSDDVSVRPIPHCYDDLRPDATRLSWVVVN